MAVGIQHLVRQGWLLPRSGSTLSEYSRMAGLLEPVLEIHGYAPKATQYVLSWCLGAAGLVYAGVRSIKAYELPLPNPLLLPCLLVHDQWAAIHFSCHTSMAFTTESSDVTCM